MGTAHSWLAVFQGSMPGVALKKFDVRALKKFFA
jgi:hypothetical protein